MNLKELNFSKNVASTKIKNDVTGFVPYGVKEGCMMSDSYGTVFFTAMKK